VQRGVVVVRAREDATGVALGVAVERVRRLDPCARVGERGLGGVQRALTAAIGGVLRARDGTRPPAPRSLRARRTRARGARQSPRKRVAAATRPIATA
jgi:hypothetical protein